MNKLPEWFWKIATITLAVAGAALGAYVSIQVSLAVMRTEMVQIQRGFDTLGPKLDRTSTQADILGDRLDNYQRVVDKKLDRMTDDIEKVKDLVRGRR